MTYTFPVLIGYVTVFHCLSDLVLEFWGKLVPAVKTVHVGITVVIKTFENALQVLDLLWRDTAPAKPSGDL